MQKEKEEEKITNRNISDNLDQCLQDTKEIAEELALRLKAYKREKDPLKKARILCNFHSDTDYRMGRLFISLNMTERSAGMDFPRSLIKKRWDKLNGKDAEE